MAAYRRVDDLRSPVGWLPVHRDQLQAQRSVSSMGRLYLFKKNIYWSTLALCCCVDACMRWRWSDEGVTVLAVTRWSHRRQSDGDCQRRTGIPADGQALSWTWNTNRFLDWLIDWVKVFVSHLTQMAQNRLWHSTEETKPNTTKANSTRTK